MDSPNKVHLKGKAREGNEHSKPVIPQGKRPLRQITLQTRHTSKERPGREMNTLNQLYLKGKGQ